MNRTASTAAPHPVELPVSRSDWFRSRACAFPAKCTWLARPYRNTSPPTHTHERGCMYVCVGGCRCVCCMEGAVAASVALSKRIDSRFSWPCAVWCRLGQGYGRPVTASLQGAEQWSARILAQDELSRIFKVSRAEMPMKFFVHRFCSNVSSFFLNTCSFYNAHKTRGFQGQLPLQNHSNVRLFLCVPSSPITASIGAMPIT